MSQSERILYFLSEGNTITPLEALRMFNCFRLASRIAEIKKVLPQGQRIVTRIIERYDQEEQGVKRYAEYKLIVEALEDLEQYKKDNDEYYTGRA